MQQAPEILVKPTTTQSILVQEAVGIHLSIRTILKHISVWKQSLLGFIIMFYIMYLTGKTRLFSICPTATPHRWPRIFRPPI